MKIVDQSKEVEKNCRLLRELFKESKKDWESLENFFRDRGLLLSAVGGAKGSTFFVRPETSSDSEADGLFAFGRGESGHYYCFCQGPSLKTDLRSAQTNIEFFVDLPSLEKRLHEVFSGGDPVAFFLSAVDSTHSPDFSPVAMLSKLHDLHLNPSSLDCIFTKSFYVAQHLQEHSGRVTKISFKKLPEAALTFCSVGGTQESIVVTPDKVYGQGPEDSPYLEGVIRDSVFTILGELGHATEIGTFCSLLPEFHYWQVKQAVCFLASKGVIIFSRRGFKLNRKFKCCPEFTS